MDSESRTLGELREQLTKKANSDPAFRERLIADPRAAIKDELGLAVPGGFTVKVHEDQPDTSHLVLPLTAELGEGDLEQAVGGKIYARSSRVPGGWMRIDNDLTFWDDHVPGGATYLR